MFLGLYVNQTSADYCEWNEAGQEILFENYDFPIFYVQNERESLEIQKCYNDFNLPIDGMARDWPLCAAQLKAHMFAAVDTPTCMRRSERFSLEKAQGMCELFYIYL
jgi:nicastrin